MPVEKIASLANVTVEFVNEIKAGLNAPHPTLYRITLQVVSDRRRQIPDGAGTSCGATGRKRADSRSLIVASIIVQ